MNDTVVFRLFRLFIQMTMVFSLALVSGCSDEPKTTQTTSHIRFLDDTLVTYNRNIVLSESQEINDYISRHQWKMNISATGLRYMIYRHGNGPHVVKGATVRIRYSVHLLTGELVYPAKDTASREFIVGHGGIETGIEEGILLLRRGDRAKFIVPSHLAFGLLGDLNKIPGRAVVVYDVELLSVLRNQKPCSRP